MAFFVSGYGTQGSTVVLYTKPGVEQWRASLENPSFLCQSDRFLVAVQEAPHTCSLSLFKNDQKGGYIFCNRMPVRGESLCHISISPDETYIAGACWGDGTTFLVSLDPVQSRLGSVEYLPARKGNRKSRAHSALFAGGKLWVIDIDLDRILCFSRMEQGYMQTAELQLPDGTGPRHMLLDEARRRIYCISEYSSELWTIAYDEKYNMQPVDCVHLLDPEFTGKSFGSSICMSNDGRFLYAANRGENTIVLFDLMSKGTPQLLERFPCGGDWPRHIALIENESYLAVANQRSHLVTLFMRDHDNGRITAIPQTIPFHEASFIMDAGTF